MGRNDSVERCEPVKLGDGGMDEESVENPSIIVKNASRVMAMGYLFCWLIARWMEWDGMG